MTEPQSLPKPAALRGKVAPVKFAHAVMRTSRFREMVDWYETVLEAKAVFESENAAFLTYDEEHHRVAFLKMPLLLPRPGFFAGVEHIAFTYRDLGDLAVTYRRLGGLGIRPYWCVNHGGTTSMYYKDPDGNRVELQIDNFEDPNELNAFLYGPAFRTNNIGVDFDPEDLFARNDAGESFEELVRWKEIAPRGPDTVPVAHLGRLHGFLVRFLGRQR